MSPVGGGFGGKEDMIYQGMLALLATKTRQPIKYVMTREEDIVSTAKRHPSRTKYIKWVLQKKVEFLQQKLAC